MTRVPRGTGYCKTCTRRVLLTTKGRLFLHGAKNWRATLTGRPRCPDSMSFHYKPGPIWAPVKEAP